MTCGKQGVDDRELRFETEKSAEPLILVELSALRQKPGSSQDPSDQPIIYNHGSAGGMLSKEAFDALGPVFVSHGWVFFGPYRRGQGLSASAGPYIGDRIAEAQKTGGISAGAATLVRLLETDHLNDQLSALSWLRKQSFVVPNRIAVAGNSFGGIETVLGAERGDYCAAVASAAGAQSWAQAPALQSMMTRAVRNATAPIFFFQAANDYDLSPSKNLSTVMNDAGKTYQLKIYPPRASKLRECVQSRAHAYMFRAMMKEFLESQRLRVLVESRKQERVFTQQHFGERLGAPKIVPFKLQNDVANNGGSLCDISQRLQLSQAVEPGTFSNLPVNLWVVIARNAEPSLK